MTETTTGYAVLIKRKDGTEFFASGPSGPGGYGRAMFWKRKTALAYRAELAEHDLPGRVVKVSLTITTEEQ